MHQEDKILFTLLRSEIAVIMMQSYPGIDPDISKWKGREITDFQEDLRIKANGQISEKWFYTHMKSDNPALPRIDVLDLLSNYAGYINWQDFRYKNAKSLPVEGKKIKPVSMLIKLPLILIAVMTLLFIIIKLINTQNYNLTFIDADTGEPVADDNLRVELYMKDKTPAGLIPAEDGTITVRTSKERVNIVVKAPYYITDTITIPLRKFNHNELVILHPDYYALMISYFSKSDVGLWEKRREQLEGIFSDDAIIYQFPGEGAGNRMALYNKKEFIDKLTMPASGLRQIEILDCRYRGGRIALLRFRTKTVTE